MNRMFRMFLLLYFLGYAGEHSIAQWIKTAGPTGGAVQAIAASGTTLFAGSYGGGVFRSANDGVSWTQVNTGLTNTQVNALAVIGSRLFAGTFAGVYLSVDNGATWISTGLSFNTLVRALAVSDSLLFAGTSKGIFLSKDYGASWTDINRGLLNTDIRAIAANGPRLFAGTPEGVFVSSDTGKNWSQADAGLTNRSVNTLAVSGTNLLAGTAAGIYLSVNDGKSWTSVSKSMPNMYVWTLLLTGTNLFAGTGGIGLFLGTNNNTSWVNTGLTDSTVLSMAIAGEYLFAGTGTCVWRRRLAELITGTNETRSHITPRFDLSQNFPNPFNPSTVFTFTLPARSFVSLKLFDALGRETSTIISGELGAGVHARRWNAEGRPGGVYFYRLSVRRSADGAARTLTETKKLLLLR